MYVRYFVGTEKVLDDLYRVNYRTDLISSSLHFLPQPPHTLLYFMHTMDGCAPEVLFVGIADRTRAPRGAHSGGSQSSSLHYCCNPKHATLCRLRMHGCARVALRWSPKVAELGELRRLYFTTTFHYQVFIFCRNLTPPHRFTLMQGTHCHQMWPERAQRRGDGAVGSCYQGASKGCPRGWIPGACCRSRPSPEERACLGSQECIERLTHPGHLSQLWPVQWPQLYILLN